MPELEFMRQAKSDWQADYDDDHERPLAPRGVKAAKRMGRVLGRSGRAPDLVLTSTAVRARTTAELASEAGQWRCRIELVDSLYGADPRAVVAMVAARQLPDRVMVVGHEPTLSALVAVLVGGGRIEMPTAAVACVGFEGNWSGLEPGRGQLLWLVIPKMIKQLA